MAFDLCSIGLICADVVVRPVDDWPQRGVLTLISSMEMHLGGLAAVTAAVFAQLGGRVAFLGKLGDDGFGSYLRGFMETNGVDMSHVEVGEGERSPSTAVFVSSDGERTFLHYPGPTRTFGESDIDLDVACQARLVHWGGPSVTPNLDGEPMGRVFKAIRERGVETSLDTCYDGSGTWYPLIEHALPHTTIAMTSFEEACLYTGQKSPDSIADFLLDHGPRIAVVKLGEKGVYVKTGDLEHHVPACKVKPVDTTGAGDAACAGFLYGYLEGWDLLRCAKLANAVGALTVQHVGGAEAVQSLEQALALVE